MRSIEQYTSGEQGIVIILIIVIVNKTWNPKQNQNINPMKENTARPVVQLSLRHHESSTSTNLNKKTLICIPLPHVTIIWMYTTRIAKCHENW